MKLISNCFSLLLLLCLLGCNSGIPQKQEAEKKSSMQAAKYLRITESKSGALIEITHPDTFKKERYFLRKKGSQNQQPGYVTLDVPLTRMIVLSSPYIGMLGKLDATSCIVATTDRKYIYNSQVLSDIRKGKIRELHDEFQASTEAILATKAEALFFSSFSTDFPKEKLIEKTGTLCIPCYDWRETAPLGKAEWIKLFGLLVGKEQDANDYFDEISSSYFQLKSQVQQRNKSCRVFCGNLLGDAWFSPAGSSFFAAQIKDAGGSYLFSYTQGSGSYSTTFEQIMNKQQEADVWLDPGVASLSTLLRNQPKMRYFNCVKNKEVYCYSHQMNKYWELSAIEPHRILSDLIQIFSGRGKQAKEMYFYRNIAH
jgi:iron complex transport system substrate-binding protein